MRDKTATHASTTTETEFADVVIVGSGFGGLAAAKQLSKSKVNYVLISSTPEHLFQPLLYQVATGVLPVTDIAPPVAQLLRGYPGADVRLGRVVDIDPAAAVLTYETPNGSRTIGYGSLIAATGANQSYFGRDHFADATYSLKTADDARRLRSQIERVFAAAANADLRTRQQLLHFVVVGAGPTGVEVAGQLKELGRRHYRTEVSVTLVEGAEKVLPPFGGRLSNYARASLTDNGVDVLLGTFVTDIATTPMSGQQRQDISTVTVRSKDGLQQLEAATVVWSAGVQANDFAQRLAKATGCVTDRAGRLLVNPDCTVGGHADIYAVGDMISLNGYPGQSPPAMQEGRHVADIIRGVKEPATEFVYWDKGSMAMISRFHAVAKLNEKVQFTGPLAWAAWLAVHLFYLVGIRNRVAALGSWLAAFVGTERPGFVAADQPTAEPVPQLQAAA